MSVPRPAVPLCAERRAADAAGWLSLFGPGSGLAGFSFAIPLARGDHAARALRRGRLGDRSGGGRALRDQVLIGAGERALATPPGRSTTA
jgi:hypothetical protein